MHHQRGQALIETAAFLPLVLLAMIAIIYFSQFGVLQGRTAQAARYAALVTNGGAAASQSESFYTIESMYKELDREGASGASDPGYPTSGFVCSGAGSTNADTAASNVLYQKESLPVGVSAATAAPTFFQADTTPTSTCVVDALPMGNATLGIAPSFLTVQYTYISAQKNTPAFLQKMGFAAQQTAAAGMAYTLPASSGPVMYCNQTLGTLLGTSLAGLLAPSPYPAPTAYGGYPSPPASPTPRSGC